MNAIAPVNNSPRQVALLKAVGLDRAAPEQRELAFRLAERYELDLFLKHIVLIEGKPYITRDGLLHVAHRSGQLDGIEVSDAVIVEGFWRSTCSVYRKDMSRPFTYTGRYPTSGGNQKFAPEMAVKVGEVMALRRAFDVAAPVLEERWDVDVTTEPAPAPQSLAERAAAKAATVTAPAVEKPAETVLVPNGEAAAEVEPAVLVSQPADASDVCAAVPPTDGLGLTLPCSRAPGHRGPHVTDQGSWYDPKVKP